MPCVVLAGGGTGGHVFPMVAVARQIQELRPDVEPIFVGTQRGMEVEFVPKQGFSLEFLEVLPIRGGGLSGACKGALRAAQLIPESRRLLKKLAPSAVFSAGGYAAGPVSLAARTLGLPVGLMEPNSAIGLANYLMSPWVQRAYTAFPRVERHFAPESVRRLGVPIRTGFEPAPRASGPTKILVLGGSQGAQALNRALPEAFAQIDAQIEVVHQCGRAHFEEVQKTYRDLGLPHEVRPFIEDMPAALAAADLVVGRSGASAVSEILAVGRASLLVPYPHASGNHQYLNAEYLSSRGAAVVLENSQATSAQLAASLEQLLSSPADLEKMSEAARSLGKPHAAREIAQDFLALAGLSD